MRYVIEGTLTDIETEDDERSLIAHTQFDDIRILGEDDAKFFVRLHSYHDDIPSHGDDIATDITHPIMEAIRGKRIRIVVETLDDVESEAVADEPDITEDVPTPPSP